MVNERKTENLVRKLLEKQGYTDNQNITIEEQKSDNPKIDKLLKSASKKGSGRGLPEFIITFANKPENIVVVCNPPEKNYEDEWVSN
jgi:hypothetical protein